MEITIRKALSMAAAAVAATVMLASCQKDDPQGDGEGSSTTKLATPALSVSYPEDGTFTVSWTAVEHADSYSYTVNGGTETSTQNTSFTMTGQASGTYSIRVKAVSADEAYEDFNWAGVEATVENGAAPTPSSWEGTWSITSSQTLTWGPDPDDPRFVIEQVVDEEKTGTVTIVSTGQSDPESGASLVYVYGLCPDFDEVAANQGLGQTPALGIIAADGTLEIYPVQITDPAEGDYIAWYVFSNISIPGYDSYIGSVNGDYPAFRFTKSGNTATGLPYEGELTASLPDQSTVTGTFNVVAMDVYYFSAEGGMSIFGENPSSFAGTLELTYVSDDTSAVTGSSFSASSMPAFTSLKAKYPGVQAKAMMVK